MRICSTCGERNEDWMEICQRCGNSVANGDYEENKDDDGLYNYNVTTVEKKENKPSPFLTMLKENGDLKIVLIVLIIILICLSIYTFSTF